MVSILESIYQNSINFPDKIALIGINGEEVSYGNLWGKIKKSHDIYHNLGYKKGDRIILAANKSLDFVYFYFGAHLAGITVSPVDSEINPVRLQRIIDSVSPKAILGEIHHKNGFKTFSFEELINHYVPSDGNDYVFPQSDNIADILFTTGTTGVPKGVVLSFMNETQAAININEFIGNTSADIELLALPISHSFGLGRLRCVLMKGGTIVILGSFASMKKFYGAIEKYKVTGFGMVPASWAYISKLSGNRISEFADQLKYIEIGSAPLSVLEKQRLMKLLPHTKICMHYGLTEASRSSFISFHDEKQYLDSAGKSSPNTEIEIFNPEGVKLDCNEDGEVCVKGKHVCSGYLNADPDQYRNDFFGDYFRTGDWGFLDKDGYLHLKSRTKEIINVGGKKVSPMEVEEVLQSLPGIEEAACVAYPDPVMGEVVKAYIVGSLTPEDDKNIIEELTKNLENYKVPAIIVHVDSLPKTESGKLQRLKLKEI